MSTLPATTPYRVGSPFAPEPSSVDETNRSAQRESVQPDPEKLGEGTWEQTAVAATASSILLIGFAIAALGYFAAGGVAITILGMAMSLWGSTYHRSKWTITLFGMHGLLCAACYLRSL